MLPIKFLIRLGISLTCIGILTLSLAQLTPSQAPGRSPSVTVREFF
jgi:hypothetical protein